jgi:hypothetical protein
MKIKNAEKHIRHLPNMSLISAEMIEIHTLHGELNGRLHTISHEEKTNIADQAKQDAVWAISKLVSGPFSKYDEKWIDEQLSKPPNSSNLNNHTFNKADFNHPVLAAAFAHIWVWQRYKDQKQSVAVACVLAERCLYTWAGNDYRLLYISEVIHENDGYYIFWHNCFRRGLYKDYLDDDYGDERGDEPGDEHIPISEWLLWFLGCVITAIKRALKRLISQEAESVNTAEYAEQWCCSTDTLCNDFKALITLGVLKKLPDKAGRSTRYALTYPIPIRWSPAAYLRRRKPRGKYR